MSRTSSATAAAEAAAGETSKMTYSYSDLCRNQFRSPSDTSSPFSPRRTLTQPLLSDTPDEETENVVKIWRNVVQFVTESRDLCVSGNSSIRSASGASVLSHPTESAGISSWGSWNTVRLKQLTAKLRQGLRRTSNASSSSSSSVLRGPCSSDERSVSETPFEQVQCIIGSALLRPILRDEVYCIILTLLNDNNQKNERSRGWILFSLVVSIFLPSDKIFLYVAKFIDDAPAALSSNLKKIFVCLITDGPRHQPPSYFEYTAAMDRKPMELQVTLMDGSCHSIDVDSSVTSSEVISNIFKSIDLREKFGFSLFITMDNRVSSLGSEGDKVFDAISQCERLFLRSHSEVEAAEGGTWRLFVRKEISSPWEDTVKDPVATNLIYAQITRGVLLGEYVCDKDSELVTLAAKQYYCEFENEISEAGLINILSTYVPPRRLTDNRKLAVWAKHVARYYRAMFKFDCGGYDDDDDAPRTRRPEVEAVKEGVVSWATTKWTAQFSRHFEAVLRSAGDAVPGEDSSVAVSVASKGISLATAAANEGGGKKVRDVSFAQISSVCGEGGQDPELKSIAGDVLVITLIDGTVLQLKTNDANVIYRIVTYLMNGLRDRSIWAFAVKDYNNPTSNHLEAFEGDLIKLDQPAKKEALASLTVSCTNAATQRSGRIPTELLHVIATLEEPKENILLEFRSKCRSVRRSKPDEGVNESSEMQPSLIQTTQNEDTDA